MTEQDDSKHDRLRRQNRTTLRMTEQDDSKHDRIRRQHRTTVRMTEQDDSKHDRLRRQNKTTLRMTEQDDSKHDRIRRQHRTTVRMTEQDDICSQYLYILPINIHRGRCPIDAPVVVHSVDGEVLPRRMQARARQIPSYLQAYDVALPPSLLSVTGPYKSYQQPKMDHVAVPSTLSGQAELASTGVQPIRHESSSLQYGPGPVIISGSNIDTGLSNLVEQLDVGRSPSYYTSPVPQQQGNSQSECELSSGTASPFPEQLEQAYSPVIVRPKATAVPAIPLLDIRPPPSCLGAPRDVTHPSVWWQTSQTIAHMVYSASTLQSLVPQTAATYERLTTPAFSAVSRPSSYNLVSSLPHTITSVKLPICTTVHQTLVPPAYQLQITEHSQLQGQPMPALDPYHPSTMITDHYAPQSLMQTSVQNWYPLTVAPTMPHMAAPARPA
ncbi:hypothetical protein ROHU_015925 [Labeo rohita]|uniref:Uncharacterized protein n=1 Tax=Labeo rohita TaxID=84645 RepID=A0A498NMM8_LABRO|nr:hypothetical protein ROHU_015925 [Labeo rohita]